MEAELYPVRPDEQPREGARKCARLRAQPTVPEEEAEPDEAGEPRGDSEGASASGAAHVSCDVAVAGGASWAAVLAMQEVGDDRACGMDEVGRDAASGQLFATATSIGPSCQSQQRTIRKFDHVPELLLRHYDPGRQCHLFFPW